jgi:hypothetical protein
MFEQINEAVEVLADFKAGRLVPIRFVWSGRVYSVSKLNLTYHHSEGRGKAYYFAVSDGANYFKLKFDTESLVWTLLESNID